MLPILHMYVVVTIMGAPAMSMRWANDDYDSCAKSLEILDKGADDAFRDPAKLDKFREKWPTIEREDIKNTCEMLPGHPKLNTPVPLR